MRQGPVYGQHVGRGPHGEAVLLLPLELEQEWEKMKTVSWRDNGDGTYTLTPKEDW